jgi:pimeloyl-ACP methyl ester carboxylesterase
MSATFVLVHGGFHGGWCWEQVVPLLESAGHFALAPDMPGMGADPTPHGEITLASTAGHLARIVSAQSGPIVLVGHSMGGMFISEAAELVSARITGLIYVAAVLLARDGQGGQVFVGQQPAMTRSEDGYSVECDRASAPETFYNTTDPAIAEAAVDGGWTTQ